MAQHKILWVRFDAIGDNILAAAMLPHLHAGYDNPLITVVCQDRVAELYESCPYVNEVIGVDKMRLFLDSKYRNDLLVRLQSGGYDVAFDSAYSWDKMSNFFVVGSMANERISVKDQMNVPTALREKLPHVLTRLVDTGGLYVSEMDRHSAFLRGIGIPVENLKPVVWTTPDDDRFADDLIAENGLEPGEDRSALRVSGDRT